MVDGILGRADKEMTDQTNKGVDGQKSPPLFLVNFHSNPSLVLFLSFILSVPADWAGKC
jgi:hypothetical protein